MERISTGNAPLDQILHGGFPANAIHIVMGSPGTGKTLLAEQLAFTNATSKRPAVYLTTFSEPLTKFLAFLQEYTFADPSRIGTEVIYENLGEALAKDPERLATRVAEVVERFRPKILVIDSFKAIADLMPNLVVWRRQLYEVAGLLSAYSATSLWVGEYTAEMGASLPEFAVADGVIDLTRVQHGSRDFRFLRVVKLRGSGFLDGLHAVTLGKNGLSVSPRLVMPVLDPGFHPLEERVSSGIQGLDSMIHAGWLRGTTTLVRGPSGSGKTILSLQFLLEGVRAGEPGLLVNFEENPAQLARVMRHLGWDPGALMGPRSLNVFFTSPIELQIDTIIAELFERVRTNGVRRVAVDAVSDLAISADDPLRVRDYLFALTQQLSASGITSMFTVQEGRSGMGVDTPEIAYLGDNVLSLEMTLGEDIERTIRVLKSRGSAHDGHRHPVAIRAGGIVVS